MRTPERTPDPATREQLEAIAAEWLARHDAGLSATERAEFDAWLAADAQHAAAWAELESTWTAFDRPRQQGIAHELFARLHQRQRRRSRIRGVVAGGLTAAACAVVVFLIQPGRRAASVESLAGGILSKPEKRALADGSVVELNAGAEIVVSYTSARREVSLTRGEAHFEVTTDASRPFVVRAGRVEVRAVGTAFAVKLNSQAVDVLVTEGIVAVDRPAATVTAGNPAPSSALMVERGGRVSVPVSAQQNDLLSLSAESVSHTEINRLLAWRGPRLELSRTTLHDAVATLNRENSLRIVIRDAEVGEMRLSGVFRADDAEGFVRLLESHYEVSTEWHGTREVLLRKGR